MDQRMMELLKPKMAKKSTNMPPKIVPDKQQTTEGKPYDPNHAFANAAEEMGAMMSQEPGEEKSTMVLSMNGEDISDVDQIVDSLLSDPAIKAKIQERMSAEESAEGEEVE